jgi:hypothetical protein
MVVQMSKPYSKESVMIIKEEAEDPIVEEEYEDKISGQAKQDEHTYEELELRLGDNTNTNTNTVN